MFVTLSCKNHWMYMKLYDNTARVSKIQTMFYRAVQRTREQRNGHKLYIIGANKIANYSYKIDLRLLICSDPIARLPLWNKKKFLAFLIPGEMLCILFGFYPSIRVFVEINR